MPGHTKETTSGGIAQVWFMANKRNPIQRDLDLINWSKGKKEAFPSAARSYKVHMDARQLTPNALITMTGGWLIISSRECESLHIKIDFWKTNRRSPFYHVPIAGKPTPWLVSMAF